MERPVTFKLDPVRFYYCKVTLAVYAAWGIAFLSIGTITTYLPKVNLALFIDGQIPLLSKFVWLYMLTYLIPITLVGFCNDWHLYNRTILSFIFASCIAFFSYLMIPVEVPLHYLSGEFSARILEANYKLDSMTRANNFPSLHVAATWIFFLCFNENFRGLLLRIVFLILTTTISLSTLLVKQHLIVDALAGLVLAFLSWFLVKRMYAKTKTGESIPPKKLKSILYKNIRYFCWSAAATSIIFLLRWSIFH